MVTPGARASSSTIVRSNSVDSKPNLTGARWLSWDLMRINSVPSSAPELERNNVSVYQVIPLPEPHVANQFDDPWIRSVASGRGRCPQKSFATPEIDQLTGQHQNVSLTSVFLTTEPNCGRLVACGEPVKVVI